MQLPAPEIERFYGIWMPLLLFVNQRLQLVPGMQPVEVGGPWNAADAVKVRDALWADDSLREAFLADNPEGLSAADLAVVESWRHRRSGAFYVLRHLKKHSLFIEAEKGSVVYGVLGLATPLEDLAPFVPCYVQAVLIPFEDRIISDGLMTRYNIHFGPGIRRNLERAYADAKERDAIVTSLLPAGQSEAQAAPQTIRSTNDKVMDAFRKHLFRSGLSPKVVERDLTNVAAFAEGHLLAQPGPRSLRDFGSADLEGYLSQVRASAGLKEGQRRETGISLKRFIKFLRDTERMDYDVAEYLLELLKSPG
jgi:hypothetical protein